MKFKSGVITLLGYSMKQKNINRVLLIPIGRINPNPKQPRKEFDHESLLGLAQSIKQNGIIQPLTVRADGSGDYELIAGERRLRASLIAGLTHVPCIQMEADENQSSVLSLLENIQRQDLNFFEEADGIAHLIETWGMTQEELAGKLGKSQSTIANKLRLLKLSQSDRRKIVEAKLTERHARALLKLGEEERASVLKQIIDKNLNVSETDRLIDAMTFPDKGKRDDKPMPIVKDVRIFINTFTNAVNVMRRAGIDAVAVKQEYEEYFEYTVRIPKSTGKTKSA
jgi:ParB family chromosome partitioning protein